MLVRLFAENYGVFRDGFDLSLEATNLGSDRDRGYFEVPIATEDTPLRLLRLAAIYGPNGSGKSTVVRAAESLHNLVVHSGPSLQEGKRIAGYDPFRLDAATRNKPSTLGCEVVVGDRVMEYVISFTAEEITEERIVERGRSDDFTWLRRGPAGTIEVNGERLPARMSIDLSTVTRRNAAAISVAAQLKQDAFLGVYRAIEASLRTLVWEGPGFGAMGYSLRRLHDDSAFRTWTLDRILKPADFGITDVLTEEREIPPSLFDELSSMIDAGKLDEMPKSLEAVLSHRGVGGEYPIDLGDESTGTQKMVALAGPWYDVVHGQLTAFVDELSASLHPSLLMALLDALNAAPSRPRSQLVFTVHDPSPLEQSLRRDQVYFTEKDDEGVARLFPLAEFSDRNVHNIRKRYLEGRYGGLPRLLDFGSLFDEVEIGD
ncbi:MAG: ATP-binding protein [Phycisphaeraceae bacterium]|nr:MAG: ATP-binding protein [Phycisphaeraceae bacterium]